MQVGVPNKCSMISNINKINLSQNRLVERERVYFFELKHKSELTDIIKMKKFKKLHTGAAFSSYRRVAKDHVGRSVTHSPLEREI